MYNILLKRNAILVLEREEGGFMRCLKCNKKIEKGDTDSFEKSNVCLQCYMEGELEVSCEVCKRKFSISEINLFMRHYVCSDCSIEDLWDTVEVTCEKCGIRVKLRDACEYRGKHACRNCGLKILRGEFDDDVEEVTGKPITTRIMKWLGFGKAASSEENRPSV
jgi:hypothetical protein